MRPIQLIFPDAQTFEHAIYNPKAPWLVTAFLLGVGTLFGILVAFFQRASGGEMAGIPISDFSAFDLYLGNIIAHILIVVASHVGVAIAAWLMAKAVGGPGLIGVLYKTTGYLMPLAIPALPFIAAYTASTSIGERIGGLPLQVLYLPLAGLSAALVLSGLYALFRDVQERTPPRAAFATAGFAMFIAAIVIVA
jgi:hypothetical protein